MRALPAALLAGLFLLPGLVAADSLVDPAGDTRVYLRTFPGFAAMPPQHRYCSAPASDLLDVSVDESAGAMAITWRVVDLAAPLDCVAERFAVRDLVFVAWLNAPAGSGYRYVVVVAHREADGTFTPGAAIGFEGAEAPLPVELGATDGESVAVVLPALHGELVTGPVTRAYDVRGMAWSVTAHSAAVYPSGPFGTHYEVFDEVNVEGPITWQL